MGAIQNLIEANENARRERRDEEEFSPESLPSLTETDQTHPRQTPLTKDPTGQLVASG